MAPAVYTIRSRGNALGLVSRDRHYVVGFHKAGVARYVMHTLHPEPALELARSEFHDISPRVNCALEREAVRGATIDSSALLRLPKGDQGHESDLYLESESLEAFLLHPYERGVGLVLPYESIEETAECMVFRAHVVDPPGHSEFFRAGLGRR